MKKSSVSLIAITLFASLFFVACNPSKKIENATGAKELTLPFSEKEFKSDSKTFRAKNFGKSPDLALAKKIALQNAKNELSSNIKSTFKKVMDQYTNQRSTADVQDYENKVEENAREVVNETLSGIRVIGEKVFQEPNKSYTYWVAIELGKEDIVNSASKSISKDQKLQIDYDQKKFREEFDKEMMKLENQ